MSVDCVRQYTFILCSTRLFTKFKPRWRSLKLFFLIREIYLELIPELELCLLLSCYCYCHETLDSVTQAVLWPPVAIGKEHCMSFSPFEIRWATCINNNQWDILEEIQQKIDIASNAVWNAKFPLSYEYSCVELPKNCVQDIHQCCLAWV